MELGRQSYGVVALAHEAYGDVEVSEIESSELHSRLRLLTMGNHPVKKVPQACQMGLRLRSLGAPGRKAYRNVKVDSIESPRPFS